MYLETDNLNKHFGGVAALKDVSAVFPAGAVTAIIGPNGAGKTTLFNVMAGFVRPDSGSVKLADGDTDAPIELTGFASHRIANQGIGVLFQDIRLFDGLSALDNVAVGAKAQAGENPLNCFFRAGGVRRQERDIIEKAREFLDYVGLTGKTHLNAEQLSYGQQKLVAIARLLAGDARILLLDEPTSGVHPDMIEKLLTLIQKLADHDGRAVIMIEHNLNVVERVGDWVFLMAAGAIEVFGPPKEVLRADSLKAAFPTL
jgi:branched-chain amino acid transport system permease protein